MGSLHMYQLKDWPHFQWNSEALMGMLAAVIKKAKFWNTPVTENLNSRQKLMLNKLLDGFDGKFTSSKWGKIAKCSQDTAIRDIQDLIDKNIG